MTDGSVHEEGDVTTTPPTADVGGPPAPLLDTPRAEPSTPEGLVMSYRGRVYALGYSPQRYAIWLLNVLTPTIIQSFTKDDDGWHEAWSRFTALETAVAPLAPPKRASNPQRDRRVVVIALCLFVAGVGVGVGDLFPGYLGGQSLVDQSPSLVTHIVYLASWVIGAVLIAMRGRRAQAGAFLCVGVSVTTFGFFVADAATALTSGTSSAGLGIDLGLTSWTLCALGSACVAWAMWSGGVVGRAVGARAGVAFLAAVGALGTAITFAPPWDRFVLVAGLTGQTQVSTAGNAFDNPGAVIAGNLIVMLCVAVVPLVAVLWRPRALGVFLLGGVTMTMAAQIVSAVVQWAQTPNPAEFHISAAAAAAVHLHISVGFTWVFYVYCASVALLALLCATLWRDPRGAVAGAPQVRVADRSPLAIG